MCDSNSPESPFSRPEVQGFISQLDSIIGRMASNSANAKNWLMTIIAAVLAVQWADNQLDKVLWLLAPTVLFMFTDLYYLGLERHFRSLQKEFIETVRKGDDISNSVHKIAEISLRTKVCNTISAFVSFSIWPFYLLIVAGLFIVKYLL